MLNVVITVMCLVGGVADGDTLTARYGNPGDYRQVKVRLSAVNAPEKAQPFGQRSKQSLSDLCFGEIATLAERDTDRYGRTVADVSCKGKDAGRHQVENGLAWYDVKYGKAYGNGYSFLADLEAEARTAKRGLWADVEPVAPWEWRRMR